MVAGKGLHHLSRRKHSNNSKEFISGYDKFLTVFASVAPFVLLPQIIIIFVTKSVAGLSLITWSLLTLFTIPWIIYGFLHKEKPIIITYLLFLLLNLAVVVGIIIYG